jgi:hypothetical protein
MKHLVCRILAGYRFTGCSGFVGDRPGSLLDGRLPRWLRTDPSGRRYCMNRREKVVEKVAGIATILPLLTAALSASTLLSPTRPGCIVVASPSRSRPEGFGTVSSGSIAERDVGVAVGLQVDAGGQR